MKRVPIRGRGAPGNPANRFETLSVEREDWSDPSDPLPRTRLLRDHSRSIITRNQSPDLHFEASLNPYRGCETGCVYCLAGDTEILMGDGSLKRLSSLRRGDSVYGTVRRGALRWYVRTTVLAHWHTVKHAYRITLEDGTEVVASADHRFLTLRGWKHVTGSEHGPRRRPHLTTNSQLLGFGRAAESPRRDSDYQRGYLCGVIRGDGHLRSYHCERAGRTHGDQHHFRLAMTDTEALDRTALYLSLLSVKTHRFIFQEVVATRASIVGIRTHSRTNVERIRRAVAWPRAPTIEWSKGFLAGIFDAEGSFSSGVLRISNTDPEVIDQTLSCFGRLFLPVRNEPPRRNGRKRPVQVIRVLGGATNYLRFFGSIDPAIRRKRSFEGLAVRSRAKLRIVSVEPLESRQRLYDITTGTGDFIANGVVSHNCYARPTHEYLGFSAGLDFETNIVVKEDAADLLRRELASPRWKPQTLLLSGVTDPYQPAERRLRITRGCIAVLAEFRNPVAVITKHHLVTRDADLLAELAEQDAAMVTLSITTLDRGLQRVMEPRGSTPDRRLRAIEKLAAAGIPVCVNVAPIIPGLTEHETPAILEAAASAGASAAGYTLLRLPWGVADLFAAWLDCHFPHRKEKVLSRIRSIRGGRLNDPRFGSRMRGEGAHADQISRLFHLTRRRLGLDRSGKSLSTDSFRQPRRDGQTELFAS